MNARQNSNPFEIKGNLSSKNSLFVTLEKLQLMGQLDVLASLSTQSMPYIETENSNDDITSVSSCSSIPKDLGVFLLQTLPWRETLTWSRAVKRAGIAQFIRALIIHGDLQPTGSNTKCLSSSIRRNNSMFVPFLWGDEIEYMLVDCQTGQLACIADQVLINGLSLKGSTSSISNTEDGKQRLPGDQWHPEYARYMIESQPRSPYNGHDLLDICSVLCSMQSRRAEANCLLKDKFGCKAVTLTSHPLLGTPQAFSPNIQLEDSDSKFANVGLSDWVPDWAIMTHPRFPALTRNIRERRGGKVEISVPLISLDDSTCAAPSLPMDAMCFGMGCCCLQLTFQAPSLEMACLLFDHLIVMSPWMMALSAASPGYRGHILDTLVDCRWSVIEASVDDRTPEERQLGWKSRFGSVSRYLGWDAQHLNDLSVCPVDQESLRTLRAAGVEEPLALHVAHLFIRDPLVLYRGQLPLLQPYNNKADEQEQHNCYDPCILPPPPALSFFDNIQSTNWQTVRLKPPATGGDPDDAWRVEFRPMEVQKTDEENTALVTFVILVIHLLLKDYQKQQILRECKPGSGENSAWFGRPVASMAVIKLLPISLVDENMRRAQLKDAVLEQRFWTTPGLEQPLHEIILPLVTACRNFLGELQGVQKWQRDHLERCLALIEGRVDGKVPTNARWMRNEIQERVINGKTEHEAILDLIVHEY